MFLTDDDDQVDEVPKSKKTNSECRKRILVISSSDEDDIITNSALKKSNQSKLGIAEGTKVRMLRSAARKASAIKVEDSPEYDAENMQHKVQDDTLTKRSKWKTNLEELCRKKATKRLTQR